MGKRKKKTLTEIAKEIGVSPSYLSQVKHGTRPASKKFFKQLLNFGIIFSASYGEVSELADEHDLGSCGATRGGSTPPFPTLNYEAAP